MRRFWTGLVLVVLLAGLTPAVLAQGPAEPTAVAITASGLTPAGGRKHRQFHPGERDAGRVMRIVP